jgi:uncharacterized 2Fe-2S/4Fe-4S cluster protein (DUF4445 family)
MGYQIDFEPIGRRVNCVEGETLLEIAQRSGVMLAAVCGGVGICTHCKIRVMAGSLSPVGLAETAEFSEKEISAGWRLACQTRVCGDVQVFVPAESLVAPQRTQTEGQALTIDLDLAVRAVQVEIPTPTISDVRSDADRIRDRLGDPSLSFPIHVLSTLSPDLRAIQYHPTIIVHGHQVVSIRPSHSLMLGLAVDIGTTKLAGYLLDLNTGETLASAGRMNPQIAYGEDVMARITHTMSHLEDGREQLRVLVVKAVNALANDLCSQSGHSLEEIVDAVVVGNTAMHHLFLGLPVLQLGMAPYIPSESAALDLPCHEVGLDLAPGAWVHLLPNIAGFVGADHVAMLLATDLPSRGNVVLALDIGTNTEISLLANGRHLTCSTASGPAFEGAHIRYGMRAATGAIEKVSLCDGQVLTTTVENQAPIGLCGSGILDLVAELRLAGLLTARGGFFPGNGIWKEHFCSQGDVFIVVPGDRNAGKEITFSREDVNEIQLAKGAIRAGAEILLKLADVTEAEIDEVVVAGAFGTYLDVKSGIDIGMFPRVDPGRFVQVGNAAGAGARLALLSVAQRARARQIARNVEYVELLTQKNFPTTYARALFFE